MKPEDLIPYASNLVSQFIQLVSGPKLFISQLNFDDEKTFKNALLFFTLTIIVTVMLEGLYTTSEASFFDVIKNTVIFHVVGLFITSWVVFISWRIVAGSASYKNHTILTLYFMGVGLVIWSVSSLLSKGYLKAQVKDEFDHSLEFINLLLIGSNEAFTPAYESIAKNDAVFNSLAVFAAGVIISLVWFIFTWGSYRTLNQRSRIQSAIAFIIFLVLSYPISWLLQIAQQSADITLF